MSRRAVAVMENFDRWLCLAAACLLASTAHAQSSSFDAAATGQAEPVPMLVRQDLQQVDGRAEIRITPEAITSGGQHFLRASNWGFWLWSDELHMHFYDTAGARYLVRLKDPAGEPWPGVTPAAGAELTFTLSWSPAGVAVFGSDGALRAYLEGSFATPADDLAYGAAADGGGGPYTGLVSVDVYPEPASFDPCSNYPQWGTLQVRDAGGTWTRSQSLIDQPTCAPAPDPDTEPSPVIDGQATLTLAWTAPTENEDGSSLEPGALEGFVIYWGAASRVGRCSDAPSSKLDTSCYEQALDLPNGQATSSPVELSISEDTTLYFAMAAYLTGTDANGEPQLLLSRYSNEIARQFVIEVTEPEPATPAPGAPAIQQIQVQFTCTHPEPGVTCTIREL